jgi:hypothetical protein
MLEREGECYTGPFFVNFNGILKIKQEEPTDNETGKWKTKQHLIFHRVLFQSQKINKNS